MKYFVVHHPPLVERRKELERQLEERGIIAEWITVCSPDEAEIIKEKTGVPLSIKYISNSMKFYKIFKKIIDEDIPYAIVFEDDTIFTEYFDIKKIPLNFPYVKLCKPVGDSFCTNNGTPFICANNGLCDAFFLTKEFAENSLKNIQLRKTMDLEIQNTLVKFYQTGQFLCIPMCYQLGPSPSESIDDETWIQYINNMTHKTFDYDELLSDPSLISTDTS